jgi:hypothetical protein
MPPKEGAGEHRGLEAPGSKGGSEGGQADNGHVPGPARV